MTDKNKSALSSALNDGLNWVDARFPLTSNVKAHLTEYYAPKNFNFWYFFWVFGIVGFGAANIDRYFLNHALQTRCGFSIRFC